MLAEADSPAAVDFPAEASAAVAAEAGKSTIRKGRYIEVFMYLPFLILIKLLLSVRFL